MLYTATQLAAADAGDEAARRRVRLLTPLLKFRACRDARRVTGDAMEVRGGCGYIEEWSDARLLRDAHLGSIWEGTSNIVALDALRAIRRDEALAPLLEALSGTPYDAFLAKAGTFAKEADDAHARQAATALYYASAAAILWREGLPRRQRLAELVRVHRLEPRDPFEAAADTFDDLLQE
jgi:hypothetical protein